MTLSARYLTDCDSRSRIPTAKKTAITDSSDVNFDAGIQDAGMKNKRGYSFACRRRHVTDSNS